MRKLLAFIVLLTALQVQAANTYYISKSAGADTNTSTQAKTKATAWAHLPGMASCANNCASYTPVAGDTFILMGCDVWVNSDLPVLWNWSGSAGNVITIGVDKTWFNTGNCPSTWNRPIFDAQKALLTPNVMFRAAASNATSYGILDNIEFKGLFCNATCASTNQNVVACFNNCTHWTFSNNYIHGWNIVTDSNCYLFQSAATDDGTVMTQNVIDGSDATGASPPGGTCEGVFPGIFPVVSNNVIHDLVNGVVGHTDNTSNLAVISGNLIYNIIQTNGTNHDNAIEIVGGGTYYVYNNVVHDAQGENFMFGNNNETDYVWNNLWYNINGNAPEGPQTTSQTNITSTFWNNTIVSGSGQKCIFWNAGDLGGFLGVTIENNHCITTNGTGFTTVWNGTSATLNNNILQTPTVATGQGYTSSETFAYSPTLISNSTVGAGKQICGVEKTCTGNFAALASDTNYACSLQTISGVIQSVCPARTSVVRHTTPDTGAYEFSSSVGLSPTSLSFGNQTVNTTSAGQVITLTNNTGVGLVMTSVALTGTNSGDFAITGNTCTGTIANAGTCTTTITFTPSAGGNRSASAVYTDSDASSPQSVPLSGTGTISTPSASPGGGSYIGTQTVSLTQAQSLSMCYRLDGVNPSSNGSGACSAGSTLYSIPLVVSVSETIKAIAMASGGTDSSVLTAAYVISGAQTFSGQMWNGAQAVNGGKVQ